MLAGMSNFKARRILQTNAFRDILVRDSLWRRLNALKLTLQYSLFGKMPAYHSVLFLDLFI